MRMSISQLNAILVSASAAFDSSHIEEPAIDAFSSHTKPAGVLVGHKPSEKREARRERKAKKVSKACGRNS